jgi:hypothetical protein
MLTTLTKMEILEAFSQIEHNFEGYWCQGEECKCERAHWVIHDSKSTCWECMHDPCACRGPLVWDEDESAYYCFFLSCDGQVKKNIWMSEPKSDLEKMNFKMKEKKRKDRLEKKKNALRTRRTRKIKVSAATNTK